MPRPPSGCTSAGQYAAMKVAAMSTVATGATRKTDGGGAERGDQRQNRLGLRVAKMLSWIRIISSRNTHATTCAARLCCPLRDYNLRVRSDISWDKT